MLLDNHSKQCVYCGSREHLTIDHYIPRSRGGTSDLENLVLACNDCNNAKGDKLPLEFVWSKTDGNSKQRGSDSGDQAVSHDGREENQAVVIT